MIKVNKKNFFFNFYFITFSSHQVLKLGNVTIQYIYIYIYFFFFKYIFLFFEDNKGKKFFFLIFI